MYTGDFCLCQQWTARGMVLPPGLEEDLLLMESTYGNREEVPSSSCPELATTSSAKPGSGLEFQCAGDHEAAIQADDPG